MTNTKNTPDKKSSWKKTSMNTSKKTSQRTSPKVAKKTPVKLSTQAKIGYEKFVKHTRTLENPIHKSSSSSNLGKLKKPEQVEDSNESNSSLIQQSIDYLRSNPLLVSTAKKIGIAALGLAGAYSANAYYGNMTAMQKKQCQEHHLTELKQIIKLNKDDIDLAKLFTAKDLYFTLIDASCKLDQVVESESYLQVIRKELVEIQDHVLSRELRSLEISYINTSVSSEKNGKEEHKEGKGKKVYSSPEEAMYSLLPSVLFIAWCKNHNLIVDELSQKTEQSYLQQIKDSLQFEDPDDNLTEEEYFAFQRDSNREIISRIKKRGQGILDEILVFCSKENMKPEDIEKIRTQYKTKLHYYFSIDESYVFEVKEDKIIARQTLVNVPRQVREDGEEDKKQILPQNQVNHYLFNTFLATPFEIPFYNDSLSFIKIIKIYRKFKEESTKFDNLQKIYLAQYERHNIEESLFRSILNDFDIEKRSFQTMELDALLKFDYVHLRKSFSFIAMKYNDLVYKVIIPQTKSKLIEILEVFEEKAAEKGDKHIEKELNTQLAKVSSTLHEVDDKGSYASMYNSISTIIQHKERSLLYKHLVFQYLRTLKSSGATYDNIVAYFYKPFQILPVEEKRITADKALFLKYHRCQVSQKMLIKKNCDYEMDYETSLDVLGIDAMIVDKFEHMNWILLRSRKLEQLLRYAKVGVKGEENFSLEMKNLFALRKSVERLVQTLPQNASTLSNLKIPKFFSSHSAVEKDVIAKQFELFENLILFLGEGLVNSIPVKYWTSPKFDDRFYDYLNDFFVAMNIFEKNEHRLSVRKALRSLEQQVESKMERICLKRRIWDLLSFLATSRPISKDDIPQLKNTTPIENDPVHIDEIKTSTSYFSAFFPSTSEKSAPPTIKTAVPIVDYPTAVPIVDYPTALEPQKSSSYFPYFI